MYTRLSTAVFARMSIAAYRAVVVDLKEHLRRARRERWAKASETGKQEAASHASHGYWDKLTPEERSAEMKRRAKVRAKNRKKGKR